MDCINCETKARCVETRTYHPPGARYPYQRRMYVCPNEKCNLVWYMKSTVMDVNDAIDARKYIEMREKALQRQKDLFKPENEEDDKD